MSAQNDARRKGREMTEERQMAYNGGRKTIKENDEGKWIKDDDVGRKEGIMEERGKVDDGGREMSEDRWTPHEMPHRMLMVIEANGGPTKYRLMDII